MCLTDKQIFRMLCARRPKNASASKHPVEFGFKIAPGRWGCARHRRSRSSRTGWRRRQGWWRSSWTPRSGGTAAGARGCVRGTGPPELGHRCPARCPCCCPSRCRCQTSARAAAGRLPANTNPTHAQHQHWCLFLLLYIDIPPWAATTNKEPGSGLYDHFLKRCPASNVSDVPQHSFLPQ